MTMPTDLELEERWEVAGRELDRARRHVEIGVGVLDRLVVVADRRRVIEAIVARWTFDTLFELDFLAAEGESPRGAR